MSCHTDGLYEIEFQRMYTMQGRVLYKLRHLKKQLACYVSKRDELATSGIASPKLESRIELTNSRIAKYNDFSEQIEDYKDEISINNPKHAQRCAEAKIIAAAYEAAYAPAPMPVPTGFFERVAHLVFIRQK